MYVLCTYLSVRSCMRVERVGLRALLCSHSGAACGSRKLQVQPSAYVLRGPAGVRSCNTWRERRSIGSPSGRHTQVSCIYYVCTATTACNQQRKIDMGMRWERGSGNQNTLFPPRDSRSRYGVMDGAVIAAVGRLPHRMIRRHPIIDLQSTPHTHVHRILCMK